MRKPPTQPASFRVARLILIGLIIACSIGDILLLQVFPPARFWPRSVILAGVMTNPSRGEITESLYALDAASGATLWRYPKLWNSHPPVVVGTSVVVPEATYDLNALDLASGSLRWTRTFTRVGVGGNRVFGFANPIRDTQFVALDPATGRTLWTFVSDAELETTDIAIFEQRPYLVTPLSGPFTGQPLQIIALDPATGAVRWRYTRAWDEDDVSLIGVFGDHLIAFSRGALFALDDRTGAVVWRLPRSTDILDNVAAIACGAGVICLNHVDGSVTAIDASDGSARWHITHLFGLSELPLADACVHESGYVTIQTPLALSVLHASSGAIVWSLKYSSNAVCAEPNPSDPATIYVIAALPDSAAQGYTPYLIAYDAQTGHVRWRVKTAVSRSQPELLTFTDRLIQVNTNALTVYDAHNGVVLWQRADLKLTSSQNVYLIAGGTL